MDQASVISPQSLVSITQLLRVGKPDAFARAHRIAVDDAVKWFRHDGWPERAACSLSIDTVNDVMMSAPSAPTRKWLKGGFESAARDRRARRITRLERLLYLSSVVAGDIQRKLYPSSHDLEGLKVHWEASPHAEVNGDFLTVIRPAARAREQGAPHAWLVFGDGQGHGPGAGLAAALAVGRLDGIILALSADGYTDPAELLMALESLWSGRGPENVSVDMALMGWWPEDGRLKIGCTGTVTVVHAGKGLVTIVDSEGTPIGLLPRQLKQCAGPFHTVEVQLGAGDLLIAATDGVGQVEGLNLDGRVISGRQLLLETASMWGDLSEAEIARRILSHSAAAAADDQSVMVARCVERAVIAR